MTSITGSAHSGVRYRPDIDGLRALAVLPVVFYHVGVPSVGGGYVGVDIFFVISGFLITSTLLADHAQSRYSIGAFYERRIRRIVPALLTVLTATAVSGWIMMAPVEFASLSKSVLATISFASNILFFRQTGYFDLSSEYKPLLHSWSLAVEEQFYVVFPLLLALLLKVWRRWAVACLATLAVASLLLSIWATGNAASFNFFLPFTRAWELLVGSLLALTPLQAPRNPRVREGMSLLGLVAILVPILAYDHSTAFPGWTALPPVLGAALLIWTAPGTRVGATLAMRPLVYIGLISYSLYLWHWPVLVFMRLAVLGPLSGVQSLTAIALPMVLAAATLHVVERPTRDRAIWPTRRLLIVCGAVELIIGLIALFGVASHGLAGRPYIADRWTPEAEAASAAFQGDACLARGAVPPPACFVGVAGRAPTVAVWGDSHAAHLVPVLARLLRQSDQAAVRLTKAGCPPIPARRFAPNNDFLADCPAFARAAWERIAQDRQITTVIVAARWQDYLDGASLALDGDAGTGIAASHRLIRQKLGALRDLLRERGGRLVIVGQVPLPPLSPVFCLRTAAFRHQSVARCQVFSASGPRAVEQDLRQAFLGIVTDTTTGFVDPVAALCDHSWCRTTTPSGRLLYMDADHLMPAGSVTLEAQLRQVINHETR